MSDPVFLADVEQLKTHIQKSVENLVQEFQKKYGVRPATISLRSIEITTHQHPGKQYMLLPAEIQFIL